MGYRTNKQKEASMHNWTLRKIIFARNDLASNVSRCWTLTDESKEIFIEILRLLDLLAASIRKGRRQSRANLYSDSISED